MLRLEFSETQCEMRHDEIREELDACIADTMLETMRKDFNANRICLHGGDLTETPFVYERVRHEGWCVKLRLLKLNGKPISLQQYVRDWRAFSDASMEAWLATYKKRSMEVCIKELCNDVVSRAKLGLFPCMTPDMDCFNFRNGSLRWDGTDLVFTADHWPNPSLYFFDCPYDRDDTVLPYFDSIFEYQGIRGAHKEAILCHFGRLLSRQGNEWRCFMMLFGKTTNGKTSLLDVFTSFFDETDRWCLDGSMDPRWVGHYVARKKLVYYRDASAVSTTLSCNQLLQLAGNEEVISELKLQNNATISRAELCRLLRVGNDGWQVDNVWATVQRAFVVEFPRVVTDPDPFMALGLAAEAPRIAARCITAFYAVYPSLPRWRDAVWHRTPLLKAVYTKESRAVQHALACALDDGAMEWGGETTAGQVDALTVNFCNKTRRVAGSPIYHFVSVTRLGWDQDNNAFGIYLDEERVVGVRLPRQ